MTFLRGSLWLGSAQVVSLLVLLATRVLLARLLGPAAYGAFGAATNAMGVLSRVLSLGTASATQVEGSRACSDRGLVVGTSLAMSVVIGLGSLAVTWTTLPFIQRFFFSEHPQGLQAIGMLAWCMPVLILSMNLGVLLIPFGSVREYSVLQVVSGCALVLPCLLLTKWLSPLEAVMWSQVVVWLTVLGFTAFFLRRELRTLRVSMAMARRLLESGLQNWPNVCLNIGMSAFAVLFGARYLSPAELSAFVLAMNLVEGVFSPHVAMNQLLLTKVAADPSEAWPKLKRLVRLSLPLFAALFGGVVLVGFWAIPLIFGPGFGASYGLMLGLFVTGASHALMKSMANTFAGVGRPTWTTWALAGEMLAFFALLGVWGPWGLWGVVGASVVSAIVGLGLAAWRVVHSTNSSWKQLLVVEKADWDALRRAKSGLRPSETPKAA